MLALPSAALTLRHAGVAARRLCQRPALSSMFSPGSQVTSKSKCASNTDRNSTQGAGMHAGRRPTALNSRPHPPGPAAVACASRLAALALLLLLPLLRRPHILHHLPRLLDLLIHDQQLLGAGILLQVLQCQAGRPVGGGGRRRQRWAANGDGQPVHGDASTRCCEEGTCILMQHPCVHTNTGSQRGSPCGQGRGCPRHPPPPPRPARPAAAACRAPPRCPWPAAGRQQEGGHPRPWQQAQATATAAQLTSGSAS